MFSVNKKTFKGKFTKKVQLRIRLISLLLKETDDILEFYAIVWQIIVQKKKIMRMNLHIVDVVEV